MKYRVSNSLMGKLLLVGIGGWTMAALAHVEAPASVKLMQLEERFHNTESRIAANEREIAEIKKQLDQKRRVESDK